MVIPYLFQREPRIIAIQLEVHEEELISIFVNVKPPYHVWLIYIFCSEITSLRMEFTGLQSRKKSLFCHSSQFYGRMENLVKLLLYRIFLCLCFHSIP